MDIDLPGIRVLVGDCRERLREIPSGSAHCCVTSPPYWNLRDYSGGVPGELGCEADMAAYAESLAAVLREVWRILRDDGVMWLNLGDAYARSGGTHGPSDKARVRFTQWRRQKGNHKPPPGLRTRSLMGVPGRVIARVLQDGWILRSEVIWEKSCPMPATLSHWTTRPCVRKDGSGCTGCRACAGGRIVKRSSWRPASSHEPVYLLAKQHPYFMARPTPLLRRLIGGPADGFISSVWCGPFHASRLKHGAVMQPALAAACILLGSPGFACQKCGAPVLQEEFEVPTCGCKVPRVPATVVDPFSGPGTTAGTALALGRSFIGCELLEQTAALTPRRAAEISAFLKRQQSLSATDRQR